MDWRNLRGPVTAPGGIVFADEWIGSRRLQARFLVTEVIQERLLRYTIDFPYSLIGAGGSFEITPTPNGQCEFSAETHFGYDLPVAGPLLDQLLALVVPLAELRRHMREEGQNLARLVEQKGATDMARAGFTTAEAAAVARDLGIAFESVAFDLEQFRRGIEVELEHGARDPATNVTGDDPLLTGRIALAHLKEMPDYYTRLAAMEAEAERARGG